MARKKKTPIVIPPFIKFFFIGLLIVAASFVGANKARDYFVKSEFFNIRSITIDPALQFINKGDLKNLLGKNIFTIDLESIQKKLSYKYPQASHLKVTRRFPDQISVVAKKRVPFAQMNIKNRMVTLDNEGVILSLKRKDDKKLPNIIGARLTKPELVLGAPLRGPDIWTTLQIIKFFEANENLDDYSVLEINMENLSKIYFTLSNKLDIIIDRDQLAQKIRVLGVVLSKGKLDLKEVKYIDLRFKEPIIGKK